MWCLPSGMFRNIHAPNTQACLENAYNLLQESSTLPYLWNIFWGHQKISSNHSSVHKFLMALPTSVGILHEYYCVCSLLVPASWPFRCQSQGPDLLFSQWSNISKASLLSPSSLFPDTIFSAPYLPLYLGQQALTFAWYHHHTTDLCYLWFCICKFICFLKIICNSKMNTWGSFAVMCEHTQRAKCTNIPSWGTTRCLSAFLSLLSNVKKWAFCGVFNSCVCIYVLFVGDFSIYSALPTQTPDVLAV